MRSLLLSKGKTKAFLFSKKAESLRNTPPSKAVTPTPSVSPSVSIGIKSQEYTKQRCQYLELLQKQPSPDSFARELPADPRFKHTSPGPGPRSCFCLFM